MNSIRILRRSCNCVLRNTMVYQKTCRVLQIFNRLSRKAREGDLISYRTNWRSTAGCVLRRNWAATKNASKHSTKRGN